MINITFWGLVLLFIVLYLMYQHERIECKKWKRECASLHAENRALRFKVANKLSGRFDDPSLSFFCGADYRAPDNKKGE